jgi:hypothetical protein
MGMKKSWRTGGNMRIRILCEGLVDEEPLNRLAMDSLEMIKGVLESEGFAVEGPESLMKTEEVPGDDESLTRHPVRRYAIRTKGSGGDVVFMAQGDEWPIIKTNMSKDRDFISIDLNEPDILEKIVGMIKAPGETGRFVWKFIDMYDEEGDYTKGTMEDAVRFVEEGDPMTDIMIDLVEGSPEFGERGVIGMSIHDNKIGHIFPGKDLDHEGNIIEAFPEEALAPLEPLKSAYNESGSSEDLRAVLQKVLEIASETDRG